MKWSELVLTSAPAKARHLRAHSEVQVDGTQYSAVVTAHGVAMIRIAK